MSMTMFEALRTIQPGQKFVVPFGGSSNDIVVIWEKGTEPPMVKNPSKRELHMGLLTNGIEDIAEPDAPMLAALKKAANELCIMIDCSNCKYKDDRPKCCSLSCPEAAAEAIYDRLKEVDCEC